MGYKCVWCGTKKDKKSTVYIVGDIDGCMDLLPTCSLACAKSKIEYDVKVLENRINAVRNQKIIEEVWCNVTR